MAASKLSMQACSICMDEFDNPKVLSCGHTFCLRCIDRGVNRKSWKPTLVCPVCRSSVDFPSSGRAEDLATNFQLLTMLDAVKRERKDITRKKFRGYECSAHREENNLYCQTCKTLVCHTCMRGLHKIREHDVITREEFAQIRGDDIKNAKAKLERVRNIFARVKVRVISKGTTISQEKRRMEKLIDTTFKETYKTLDLQAQSLYEVVQDAARAGEYELEELEQMLNSSMESIENLSIETETISEEQDGDEVLEEINILMRDLERTEASINSLSTSLGLVFVTSRKEGQIGSFARDMEAWESEFDLL